MRSVVSAVLIPMMLLCQFLGFAAHSHSAEILDLNQIRLPASQSGRNTTGLHFHLSLSGGHCSCGHSAGHSHSDHGGSDHTGCGKTGCGNTGHGHSHADHGHKHHSAPSGSDQLPVDGEIPGHDDDAIFLNFEEIQVSVSFNFCFEFQAAPVLFLLSENPPNNAAAKSFESDSKNACLLLGQDILRQNCAYLL